MLLGCSVTFVKLIFAESWWVEVQGVQLNAVDGAGNTALMDAIRHSHKEVQASLRAAGANLAAVNVADKLCLAAAEDDTPFLEVHCPTPLAPSPCPTALTPAFAPPLHQTPCSAFLHHPLFPSPCPCHPSLNSPSPPPAPNPHALPLPLNDLCPCSRPPPLPPSLGPAPVLLEPSVWVCMIRT